MTHFTLVSTFCLVSFVALPLEANEIPVELSIEFVPSRSDVPRPHGYRVMSRPGQGHHFTHLTLNRTNDPVTVTLDCTGSTEIMIDPRDIRYNQPSAYCNANGMAFQVNLIEWAANHWSAETGAPLSEYAIVLSEALRQPEEIPSLRIGLLPNGKRTSADIQREIASSLRRGDYHLAASWAEHLASGYAEMGRFDLGSAYLALVFDTSFRAIGRDPVSEGLVFGRATGFGISEAGWAALGEEEMDRLSTLYLGLSPHFPTTPESGPHRDIIAAAENVGNLSTLLAAFEAVGLSETLATAGPFTVFAPTDDAFAELPEGMVAELLRPENRGQLAQMLGLYVVPGIIDLADILDAVAVVTIDGSVVELSATKIEDSHIVGQEIEALNGIIYTIDRVLRIE